MKIIFGKYRRIALCILSCFIFWTFFCEYVERPKKHYRTKKQMNDLVIRKVKYHNHPANNRTSNFNAISKSKLRGFKKLSPKISKDDIIKRKQTVNKNNDYKPKKTIAVIPVLKDDYGEGIHVDVAKLSPREKAEYHKLFNRNGFSEYTSNLISINRTLPDKRPQACRDKKYSSKLLPTSVIITFFNEARSTLLRSIHSVINRSPSHLLTEIILVDDASDREDLKEFLDEYLQDFPIVKLIRCKKREGLIRARLLGFQHANGPVVTFLDSHIECTPGWLEPLLEPITNDKTIVTFPRIGYINTYKFKYNIRSFMLHYGVLSWRTLTFNWGYIPQQILDQRKTEAENIKSPTMPGGLFSISKEYFTSLGTYDPKLEGWGGENMELSFKIWMCNGTLLMVTCSYVGHIFRSKFPYTLPDVSKNSLRVAEVWMDDFKYFHYDYFSPNLSQLDVQDRINLRKKLQCKSFEWYYQNVLSISLSAPVDALYVGQIFSLSKPGMCLDSIGGGSVLIFPCNRGAIGNQNFNYTKQGQIRTEVHSGNVCISVTGFTVTSQECDWSSQHQVWKYQNKQFMHPLMMTCLAIDESEPQITTTMVSCSDISTTKWQMNPRKQNT